MRVILFIYFFFEWGEEVDIGWRADVVSIIAA